MQIKTLADILAETQTIESQNNTQQKKQKPQSTKKSTQSNQLKKHRHQVKEQINNHSTNLTGTESIIAEQIDSTKVKNNLDIKPTQTNKQIITKGKLDNIPAHLLAKLKTDKQKQAEIDLIKANRRLRWLAFYYLSTREHSAEELKQKLLDKGQDIDKINQLLAEFAEKGYQSDMRTAIMLIREGIRRGYGRNRIQRNFFKRKIDLPNNLDELIEMAKAEMQLIQQEAKTPDESISWLQLAVEARIKKFGTDIPKNHKEKGKQLRFLQYRGFKTEVCFDAIKHNLQSLAER